MITMSLCNLHLCNLLFYLKKSRILLCLFLFCISFQTVISQPGASLHFDGNDDRVNMGNTFNNLGDVTIEAWVRRDQTNFIGLDEIFSKEVINSFALGNPAGNLHVNFGNGSHWGAGAVSLGGTPLNTWVHWAVTRDIQTGDIYIYRNGQLDSYHPGKNKLTGSNTIPRSIGYKYFQLIPLAAFEGWIDEVRIYSRVLCIDEIQATYECELAGNEPDLIGYYQFNEGTANANNSATTSLPDKTSNGFNGVLENMALDGMTSNWVTPGGVISGVACESYIAPIIEIYGNEIHIAHNDTEPSTTDFTDFGEVNDDLPETRTFGIKNQGGRPLQISQVTCTSPKFLIINPPTEVAPGTVAYFDVQYDADDIGRHNGDIEVFSNDCGTPVYRFNVKAEDNTLRPADCIQFNAKESTYGNEWYNWHPEINNDRIDIGTDFNNLGDITISAWINFHHYEVTEYTPRFFIVGKNKIFKIMTADGHLSVCFGDGTFWGSELWAYHNANWGDYDNYLVKPNKWTHFAVTRQLSTGMMKIYINGVLAASSDMDWSGAYNSFQGANSEMTTIGGMVNPSEFQEYEYDLVPPFRGEIDELRFYNRVLCADEIKNRMFCELDLSSPNSGLLAYYQFNNGNSRSNNTAITQIEDMSQNGHTGTLYNFNLKGKLSNFRKKSRVETGKICNLIDQYAGINLVGNGIDILSGDDTPDPADNTDFGILKNYDTVYHSFTIQSTGDKTLEIYSIECPESWSFFVKRAPSKVGESAAREFVIGFTPQWEGYHYGNITIRSNACNEPVYRFSITANVDLSCVSPPESPSHIKRKPTLRNLCYEELIYLSVGKDRTATSYAWVIPPEFNIIGPSDKNSIILQPTGLFGKVPIEVSTSNACGSSPWRRQHFWGVPSVPIVSGPACLARGSQNVTYTITNVEPNVNYRWELPNKATVVSGQNTTSITINWNRTKPASIVAIGSNDCGDSPNGNFEITNCGDPAIVGSLNQELTLMPNPTADGRVKVLFRVDNETNCNLVVTDLAGKLLLTKTVTAITGLNTIPIDLSAYANGMYLLTVKTDSTIQTIKVIKGQ